MSIGEVVQGGLFASDLLADTAVRLEDWPSLEDTELGGLEDSFRAVFARFPVSQSPNESQTEDDLIWPVLRLLGWTVSLRQQNLSPHGREDVPDGLLFADEAAKDRANNLAEEWRRYELGAAVVESKRWLQPLDRRPESQAEGAAPSTQMLRYLRRVDDLSEGGLRWGILTNGARWRLYYQGARSVSEEFFEIDLGAVLDLPGHNDGLFALSGPDRRRALELFVLFFRREAFLPDAVDARTLHQRMLDEGRFHQERVAGNLSDLVFNRVFPDLARAIAAATPDAPLAEVRDAALVVLYRLLFILYAEDRNLLPVRDERYDDYGLRERVRGDVGRRKDRGDTFSETASRYWLAIDDLCRAIDEGDASIGLPPYNGGLFHRRRAPLLDQVRLGDQVMAGVIDALSFEAGPEGRRYINYRDLSVQQLGSIYERLLEHEIVRDGDGMIAVRPNVFARKGSGSYYTPDELVGLILEETVGPLVRTRLEAFAERVEELRRSRAPLRLKVQDLERYDPARKLLELKVCDPAMGSGHFLVGLVDYLADRVIASMAEAEAAMEGYVSPLAADIDAIRDTVLRNAAQAGWTVHPEQLDDRHVVRRMVLKRCVYGVDKNPMAVELAKVSLWLHTFTVGAPLGFLDHHLRCGDSLFGCWVRQGIEWAEEGGSLFLQEPLSRAVGATLSMQTVERLNDAEIDEAQRSAGVFAEVRERTESLDAFLSLVHAFEWLNPRDEEDEAAIQSLLLGAFGDPVDIAMGAAPGTNGPSGSGENENAEPERFALLRERARALVERAREVAGEEGFLNWQVAFPGVWSDWGEVERYGGFDAVVGNPPWDRMKLQQVEWFAARRPEIARAQRAADRRRMIAALREAADPLAAEFERANERADSALRVARTSGNYPYLSRGDVNLYSLFVERAMALAGPRGVVGLLIPSGIASDKTAAPFFRSIATGARLRALYDFENRRVFFPDVHASFKFCVFVASRQRLSEPAHCSYYLHNASELTDPQRRFPLTAEEFATVNPNTGTAPTFRTRRDAELTTAIYRRLPVLVDRSSGNEVKTWPVKYATMFHMTNDSGRFRTREELEEQEGAWPIGGNRFESASGTWVPLYEGKMVQAFDHRAARIVVNPENLHRPASPLPATLEQHSDPDWLPTPQFWIEESHVSSVQPNPAIGNRQSAVAETTSPLQSVDTSRVPRALISHWWIGWKDVTAPTNIRTVIAAAIPYSGVGNTFPILLSVGTRDAFVSAAPLMLANLNAVPLDYVARQKVQGQHLNWYIVEQLPVVPPERYEVAPFARDLGFVDETGAVRPPFRWDEERRLRLRAKLDAVYFHLYGVTDRDDVRYVYSTFPIVERQETTAYGGYRSRDLCLAYLNALAAGRPDAEPDA